MTLNEHRAGHVRENDVYCGTDFEIITGCKCIRRSFTMGTLFCEKMTNTFGLTVRVWMRDGISPLQRSVLPGSN